MGHGKPDRVTEHRPEGMWEKPLYEGPVGEARPLERSVPGRLNIQGGQLECGEKMSDDIFYRDYDFHWIETTLKGRKGRNVTLEG